MIVVAGLPSVDQRLQLPLVIGCFCLVLITWLGSCRTFLRVSFSSSDPDSLHGLHPPPSGKLLLLSGPLVLPFLIRAKLCFIGLKFLTFPDRQETCTWYKHRILGLRQVSCPPSPPQVTICLSLFPLGKRFCCPS